MAKRPIVRTSESGDESESGEPAADPKPKRPRTATEKQREIERQQKEKEESELERLRRELKKAKKRLAEQKKDKDKSGATSNADSDGESDRLPPESEDESDNGGVAVATLQASLLKRQTTTPKRPIPQARIQRREGDAAASPTVQPQEASSTVPPSHPTVPDARQASQPPPPTPGSSVATGNQRPPSGPGPSTAAGSIRNGDGTSRPSAPETPRPSAPPSRTELAAQGISQPAASATAGHDGGATTESRTTSTSALQPAPFRGGQQPKSSRARPQDYEDDVKRLLIEAISFFSLYLFTIHAFPGVTKQTELAMRAWNAACSTRETPVPYELSERMIRVIASRKSTARGDVSDNIRSAVAEAYGFRRNAAPASERHNADLAAALVENGAFHHKEFDARTGRKSKFSEHPFIVRALQIAFFGNARNGIGFVHKDVFDPIPDEALAFIHTVVHAHISEWSMGHAVKEDFSEAKNAHFYAGFLQDIRTYGAGGNATAWANIRKRMYSKAFRAGGGVTMQVHTVQMSSAAMEAATAELAGRTGLTDSEDEAEIPEN